MFISDVWNRCAIVVAIVAAAFWLSRRFPLPPYVEDIAERIFPKLTLIWPALADQHELIRQQPGDAEAARYALFFVCLFATLVIPTTRLLYEARLRKPDILPFDASDAFVLVVFALILIFPLFADRSGPRLWWNFVPDRWGFYYARQAMSFAVVGWGVMALVFYLFRAIDRWSSATDEASKS